jgi:ABC-2 type transport system ATP-binding protein
MRMRLAYAAAAHVDSDLYLFDEIMAVGDTQFHKKCVQHMDRLRNLGKAAIIVNHNEAKLEELCDRIVYLDAGRIARQRVL